MEVRELYIFDLDGTLVDSADDICAAIVQVVSEFAGPIDRAAAFQQIACGAPLGDIFDVLAPGLPHQPLIDRYREIYSVSCTANTVPFPGVIETLEKIGPQRCAVATTKRTALAQRLIDNLGMSRHFALVQGTDGFPYKPDPEILRRILGRFGVPAPRSLMVGDTVADVLCAQAAGVPCAAVLYGNGSSRDLQALKPDYVLASFSEVLSL